MPADTQRRVTDGSLLPRVMLTAPSSEAVVVRLAQWTCSRNGKGWEDARPLASAPYWIDPVCRGKMQPTAQTTETHRVLL